MNGQLSICKGCGYAIRWFTTTGLKRIPCNPQRVRFTPADGPETFVTPEGKIVRGRRDEQGPETGYISHFATCPQAAAFRRREG